MKTLFVENHRKFHRRSEGSRITVSKTFFTERKVHNYSTLRDGQFHFVKHLIKRQTGATKNSLPRPRTISTAE